MVYNLTPYTPQESVLPEGTSDDQLIAMWLHDKSDSTQEEYTRDIQQFREYVSVPLKRLTLPDLQAYADELKLLDIKPATIARRLKSIKSLLSFAQRTGYIRFNIGTMVKVPKLKKTLAEHIMTESQVFTMLAKEANTRNHALLRLLYASGIRVSEVCDLCWEDVQPRDDTGQITVFGKGEKTRTILLKKETYEEVVQLYKGAAPGTPVFRSRGGASGKAGRKLDQSQVTRIVEAAACRAGIAVYTETIIRDDKQVQRKRSRVSPHWLRHAHASHALDNGASIAVVKETLGHESIETTAGYTHVRPGVSSAQYLKI
jgi:site-specific recombinase XerD